MYNEKRWNYLKNFIEEKTEGRKLNLEERKQELKKGGYTQLKKKVQENLRCIAEREEGKNGADKIQCDD